MYLYVYYIYIYIYRERERYCIYMYIYIAIIPVWTRTPQPRRLGEHELLVVLDEELRAPLDVDEQRVDPSDVLRVALLV